MSGGSFVPNDIHLGGTHANFVLLTGPNMGGKSTLLRQVCQATLLAQLGALVPAQSLHLSPVDAVFVRMGARDNIMAGQSTFFVELNETSMMVCETCCCVWSCMIGGQHMVNGCASLISYR